MTDVKRYRISLDNLGSRECLDGRYVEHSDYDALRIAAAELAKVLELAEHKIDQHLQGQYPDGKALGAALHTIRAALEAWRKL